MALNVPENATEVVNRAKVDVQRELPGSNPFLKNSWIGAIVVAFSNRVFDFYFALTRAQLESIPDTAVLFLERWAAIWNILRNPATRSAGNIVLTGTATGTVLLGTVWVSSGGRQYASVAEREIILQSLSVTSIIRIGSTAFLLTADDHLIASNVLITITGAAEPEYNVIDSVCTVLGSNALSYAIEGTPATSTGTRFLGFTSVSVPVESIEFGDAEDQDFDAVITIQSPVTNVDDSASVDFGTISGGSDQEGDANLRVRLLERIQNPIAHFNVSEITAVAKQVTGVTRVFIQQITPAVGQVTIHFMRDNDSNPIPSGAEVAVVKEAIDAILPANTDTLDVIVAAPTPIIQVFTFTAVLPNTASMKTAIENSLELFFDEKTDVGVDVVEEAYNAAIFNTVDPVTGDAVVSFTLSAPTADITIASGEIAQLGVVSF